QKDYEKAVEDAKESNKELAASVNSIPPIPPPIDEDAVRATKSLVGTWADLWKDASSAIAGSMQSAFADIVTRAKSATEAITSMVNQIHRALAESVFRQFLLGPIFAGISRFGLPVQPPDRATAVQEAPFQPVAMQRGGFVPRGTDTVPAMLSPGELVVPRDEASTFGNQRPVNLIFQSPDPQATYQLFYQNRRLIASFQSPDPQATYQLFYQNRRLIASMVQTTNSENNPLRRAQS
ncbi:MAG: hypothetical protein ACYTEW_26675, partial [Planctomycetota bacterium]